jgi:death-on-curing protein
VRHLTLGEIVVLHDRVIRAWGGAPGLRDLGALESAAAQPRMTFSGEDLYPDLPAKATALAFSLIRNHPFVDGNKRVGHAALETVLLLNGFELDSAVDEAERVILRVAGGECSREELLAWVRQRLVARAG